MDHKFLEALMKGLERNRSVYDKEKLENLVKSNDPRDKVTLNTATMDILESDDTTAIEVLMAMGSINVVARDYDGKTALSIAASAGSVKIVKLLLSHMEREDVRRYNQENLLSLEFPKILPELWLVEDVVEIIDLLSKKKIILNLEHKLAVVEFLVHNVDDCDCARSNVNARDLQKSLADLITYGSATHVNKIVSKIKDDVAAEKLQLDELDLINYIARPLSPGVMLQLYVDRDVRDVVDKIQATWEDYYPYEKHHDDEVRSLKAHQLKKNNRLSLHDVLAKNPRETYRQVVKLDFHKLSKKYSVAGDYIKGLKAKSLIRHLVEEFLPGFARALFPPLPDVCFNHVLRYLLELSNEDILSMCQVAVAKV